MTPPTDGVYGQQAVYEDGAVTTRQVTVRPGRHFGWWAEGRRANGGLFMKTWWPTQGWPKRLHGGLG